MHYRSSSGIISSYMLTNHALSLYLGDYLSVQAHKPCFIAKARGLSLCAGVQTMLDLPHYVLTVA